MMLRSLPTRFAASVVLAASTAVLTCDIAAAQVYRPHVEEAARQQPQPPPQPEPLVNGIIGLNRTQGVLHQPRFKVEAVNFEAVDESGPNSPGADEVFAVFANPQNSMVTTVFEGVQTGQTRQFGGRQNCIWPAAPDTRRDHSWSCAANGATGPVQFTVILRELDPQYNLTADFCIHLGDSDVYGPGTDAGCYEHHSDLLFRYDFHYEVAQILSRLDPACRCFTETASHRQTDWRGDSEYQVTVRITRVDAEGEPPAVDRNAGADDPMVLRSGTLVGQAGQGFEFDAGAVVNAGADFAFSRSGGSYLLTPNGGAKIWTGDATARGYAACFAQRASASYVTTAVTVPAAGQYACYVTSDGHVGEMRITSLMTSPFGGPATLTLSYTTWQ